MDKRGRRARREKDIDWRRKDFVDGNDNKLDDKANSKKWKKEIYSYSSASSSDGNIAANSGCGNKVKLNHPQRFDRSSNIENDIDNVIIQYEDTFKAENADIDSANEKQKEKEYVVSSDIINSIINKKLQQSRLNRVELIKTVSHWISSQARPISASTPAINYKLLESILKIISESLRKDNFNFEVVENLAIENDCEEVKEALLQLILLQLYLAGSIFRCIVALSKLNSGAVQEKQSIVNIYGSHFIKYSLQIIRKHHNRPKLQIASCELLHVLSYSTPLLVQQLAWDQLLPLHNSFKNSESLMYNIAFGIEPEVRVESSKLLHSMISHAPLKQWFLSHSSNNSLKTNQITRKSFLPQSTKIERMIQETILGILTCLQNQGYHTSDSKSQAEIETYLLMTCSIVLRQVPYSLYDVKSIMNVLYVQLKSLALADNITKQDSIKSCVSAIHLIIKKVDPKGFLEFLPLLNQLLYETSFILWKAGISLSEAEKKYYYELFIMTMKMNISGPDELSFHQEYPHTRKAIIDAFLSCWNDILFPSLFSSQILCQNTADLHLDFMHSVLPILVDLPNGTQILTEFMNKIDVLCRDHESAMIKCISQFSQIDYEIFTPEQMKKLLKCLKILINCNDLNILESSLELFGSLSLDSRFQKNDEYVSLILSKIIENLSVFFRNSSLVIINRNFSNDQDHWNVILRSAVACTNWTSQFQSFDNSSIETFKFNNMANDIYEKYIYLCRISLKEETCNIEKVIVHCLRGLGYLGFLSSENLIEVFSIFCKISTSTQYDTPKIKWTLCNSLSNIITSPLVDSMVLLNELVNLDESETFVTFSTSTISQSNYGFSDPILLMIHRFYHDDENMKVQESALSLLLALAAFVVKLIDDHLFKHLEIDSTIDDEDQERIISSYKRILKLGAYCLALSNRNSDDQNLFELENRNLTAGVSTTQTYKLVSTSESEFLSDDDAVFEKLEKKLNNFKQIQSKDRERQEKQT